MRQLQFLVTMTLIALDTVGGEPVEEQTFTMKVFVSAWSAKEATFEAKMWAWGMNKNYRVVRTRCVRKEAIAHICAHKQQAQRRKKVEREFGNLFRSMSKEALNG